MEVVFDQLEVALIGTGLRIEHDDGVAEILAGESVLHHPLRRIAVSAVPLRPRSSREAAAWRKRSPRHASPVRSVPYPEIGPLRSGCLTGRPRLLGGIKNGSCFPQIASSGGLICGNTPGTPGRLSAIAARVRYPAWACPLLFTASFPGRLRRCAIGLRPRRYGFEHSRQQTSPIRIRCPPGCIRTFIFFRGPRQIENNESALRRLAV